jgi:hypothetical protein
MLHTRELKWGAIFICGTHCVKNWYFTSAFKIIIYHLVFQFDCYAVVEC